MSDDTTSNAPVTDIKRTPIFGGGKAEKKPQNEGLEIFKTIFYALLIALVLRVLLFQPFTIPSASMEPNLYEGDYIVVSKWSYGYSKHSIPFSPPVFNGRILGREPARGDSGIEALGHPASGPESRRRAMSSSSTA